MELKRITFRTKSENQQDFVLANATIATEEGCFFRGIRVLKSKFENSGPYLELPGFTGGTDSKRLAYYSLPDNAVKQILAEYEKWSAVPVIEVETSKVETKKTTKKEKAEVVA